MKFILILSDFRTSLKPLANYSCGSVVKNLPANAEDTREASSVPGSGRSPGGGNGNLLQFSCLENPTDRGTWGATFHGVAKSQTEHAHMSRHSLE